MFEKIGAANAVSTASFRTQSQVGLKSLMIGPSALIYKIFFLLYFFRTSLSLSHFHINNLCRIFFLGANVIQ